MVQDLPPLTALRAFHAAGRLLSFQEAARELRVTPSAVSHQIRTLEDWMGVTLFTRGARRIELTVAGRKLLRETERAFSRIAMAANGLKRSAAARLKVSSLPLITSAWLIPRLAKFEAKHPDKETAQAAGELVALMTPIIKSFLTDVGFDVTNLGVQIYGGHGYVQDHGMEQYVRDARITQIYEGANGIQGLDLVGRKMADQYGKLLRRFFHPMADFIAAEKDNPALKDMMPSFMSAFGKLQMASLTVGARGFANPDEAGAAASDYLKLFAYVALGAMWLKMAKVAAEKLPTAGDKAGFYEAKLKTARFYFQKLMPQANALNLAIMAGAKPVMDFPAEAF